MVVQRFTVVGKVIRNLPAIQTESVKPERKSYSLYEKKGNGWRRARTVSYDMPNAYRVWGDDVLASPNELSIRRVELSTPEA